MNIKTVKLIDKYNKNQEYIFEFVNESKSTYNGFKHTTTLFLNNCIRVETKINYINRTWEYYTFQSVMNKSLNSIIEDRTEQLKEEYKNIYNINRISGKHKEQLNKYINDDRLYIIYKAVYSEIEHNSRNNITIKLNKYKYTVK